MNSKTDLTHTFKLLVYSLILKFCYNLVILSINKQYYSIDLDSNVWHVTHAKNIFNTLEYLSLNSCEEGETQGDIKENFSSEEYLRILGMFRNHQ